MSKASESTRPSCPGAPRAPRRNHTSAPNRRWPIVIRLRGQDYPPCWWGDGLGRAVLPFDDTKHSLLSGKCRLRTRRPSDLHLSLRPLSSNDHTEHFVLGHIRGPIG